ncbi:hypothetical protein, variant [Cryptococcus amylolentus CBS 6039]|uniref:Uncharacterized protein n=1 Tax=Cryptococcus amylolentus CBS 6039 TaxID=1295533 RepID=A0A1E3HRU7_9TREE|nr:hypothetical protein L202_04536 [Cryptococcus amylolentus CBS 6039]XP_018994078.1 hypothetical protein, variant [Cryptococcus amylolentus CBS 6039]ODN79031.1 hypothetical protein L202_04536 [Cryptococcus amylolentus CBS 6039]ODN79032.1 hypothetical protein, variant [Cryptococcus amylolentus CBS 6039]
MLELGIQQVVREAYSDRAVGEVPITVLSGDYPDTTILFISFREPGSNDETAEGIIIERYGMGLGHVSDDGELYSKLCGGIGRGCYVLLQNKERVFFRLRERDRSWMLRSRDGSRVAEELSTYEYRRESTEFVLERRECEA